jgi:hypothetical protein
MLTDHDLAQIAEKTARVVFHVGSVLIANIPHDERPAWEWIRECLEKSTEPNVWAVVRDTPNVEEEAIVTAITGNGKTSEALAGFYAMCHAAVPALLDECQRLRALVGPHQGGNRYRVGRASAAIEAGMLLAGREAAIEGSPDLRLYVVFPCAPGDTAIGIAANDACIGQEVSIVPQYSFRLPQEYATWQRQVS